MAHTNLASVCLITCAVLKFMLLPDWATRFTLTAEVLTVAQSTIAVKRGVRAESAA